MDDNMTGALIRKGFAQTATRRLVTIKLADGQEVEAHSSPTAVSNSCIGDTVRLVPDGRGEFTYYTLQRVAPLRFNRHTSAIGWD